MSHAAHRRGSTICLLLLSVARGRRRSTNRHLFRETKSCDVHKHVCMMLSRSAAGNTEARAPAPVQCRDDSLPCLSPGLARPCKASACTSCTPRVGPSSVLRSSAPCRGASAQRFATACLQNAEAQRCGLFCAASKPCAKSPSTQLSSFRARFLIRCPVCRARAQVKGDELRLRAYASLRISQLCSASASSSWQAHTTLFSLR